MTGSKLVSGLPLEDKVYYKCYKEERICLKEGTAIHIPCLKVERVCKRLRKVEKSVLLKTYTGSVC